MTDSTREQLIVSPDVQRLSPLEAKAARRRQRVRKIIVDARLQDIEKTRKPTPRPGVTARPNRGDKVT